MLADLRLWHRAQSPCQFDSSWNSARAPTLRDDVVDDGWAHAYSREEAAFPVSALRQNKYWPPVSRIDQVYGDRNFVCACPPLDAYRDTAD